MKNMTEKEWEEFLKQQADEMPVPDSLSPENMMKRIQAEKVQVDKTIGWKNDTKKQMKENLKQEQGGISKRKLGGFRKWMYRISASAAVFLCGGVIAFGGIYGYGKWQTEQQSKKDMTARDSLCVEVLEQANQVSMELEAQKEWYEWAKKNGVDQDNVYRDHIWYGDDVVFNATMDMAETDGGKDRAPESVVQESAKENDYSATNVQVEGIDEADIIKTDGEYLYILEEDEIYIVDTKDELKLVGNIPVGEEDGYFCKEMYIRDRQLITIERKTGYYFGYDCVRNPEECDEEELKDSTKVLIYNIENKEQPVLEKEMVQDGYYLSSRVTEDYLYLFTEYTTYRPDDIEDFDAYVPCIGGEELSFNDVCILPEGESTGALLVSAVDLKEKEIKDKIMLTSGAHTFYVSEENIYSAIRIWKQGNEYTEIVKVAYQEDKLEYVGKTEIEGYVTNQYFMDEKDGFLRLVTHVYCDEYYYDVDVNVELEETIEIAEEFNRLYVLDANLKEVGRIDDVAPDEELYSCRFMGDMAYFVTFRQVDPLFAADLSDPYNPVLTGQLKIPGFSEYLQSYGEGLLLGVGYDADEETGRRKGVKLTMFDINDPADIKEISSTYLPECSDVVSDAKAILANANKNVIGISTYRYDGDMYYYCLSYEDGEFVTNMQEQISSYRTRGIYIGDVLYVANNREVKAVSLEDYSLIETLEFPEE